MFKHIKKPVRRQDNAETVSTGSGILLEPLEPRILLSAEIAIPPQDLAQDLLLVDSQNAAIDVDDGLVFDTPVTGDQPEADLALSSVDVAADDGVTAEDVNVATDELGANDEAAAAEENNAPADSGTDISADSTPAPEVEAPVTDIQFTTLPVEALSAFNQQAGLQLVFVDPSVPEFESLLSGLPVAETEATSLSAASVGSDTPVQDNSTSTTNYIDLASSVDINAIDAPVILDSENDSRTVQVFVLDSSRDGLTQITDVLAQYDNVTGVHVLSHGAAGYLRLGNASINNSNLNSYQSQLRDWGSSLTEQADVLLYGCDVADGESGVNFIQRISEFTGADVAASRDDTGGAVVGGDWVLENSTGLIEAPNLFASAADYNYLLDTVTVSGTTAVDNFVLTANQISDGSTDTAFADGDDIVINAGAADDVVSVSDLATALSLTVNGEGNDTLDLSGLSADLTITVQTNGDIIISDGVDSLAVSGVENLIGGSGITTLDYSLWTDAVSVDLQSGTATGFTSISNINNVTGGSGNDTLIGNSGNNRITGGAGNDTLRGFAGDDTLDGGLGNDTLEGGNDNDSYYFANDFGNDTVEDSGSDLNRGTGQAGDTWDFTAVTTDITFNFGSAGYLDSDVVKAVNLSNSVTETISQQFAVETVLGGSGTGGTGSDTFNIYRTADYGSAAGLNVLLLDGQAGSDTYISYFKPAWVPISIPMDVSIRDQGNLRDTDRAIAFGSNSADLLEVNAGSVDSYKPFSITSQVDASTVTPPVVDLTGAEKQSFAYGAYGSDSGLESLEVIAKRGNDTVFVDSTPDYLAASIRGNEGDDVITVGRSAIAGSGLLDNIDSGALVIRGDEGSDTLLIDDSGDNTDNLDGVLSDAYISGMGMTVGIDYGTVETLGLAMGSGNDMFTVAGSIGGATYLTGNDGSDVINIQSASGILQARGGNGGDSLTLQNNNSGSAVSLFGESGNDILNVQRMIEPVTVRGGDDNDIINVGSAAPNAGGVVNFISDLLDVDGEAGTDILNVDDTAENEDNDLRVTSSLITGLDMRDGIRYANMEFINIATGSGSDNVDVESTAFGSLTTISTFAGDATINVSSDAPLNNGNLDGIQGELSLFIGSGVNELNISDRGSDVADDNILITENRITGLAPAAINYFTSGRYDKGVNIWLGEGSDTATITSTHSDSVTTVWANQGDDRIRAVDADGSADDGLLVLLGEGGRDTLDASAWQSPTVMLGDYGEINYNAEVKNTDTLESAASVRVDDGDNDSLTGGSANDVLIGGAGSDSLTGGGGDDVIFGDNGRVTFINGLPTLMETFDSYPEGDVRAPAEIPGGNDVIEGNAGNDWLFGGNGDDRLFGGGGDDIINGDGGKISISDGRIVAETTGFFIGGVDFIDGGSGDDWMLGGAQGDLFVGNFADDIIIGDYARITVENGKGLSVIRLGQDKLDFIASTLFTLYTPDVLLFGPAAIGGIIPSGSAATAYEPVYNTISIPAGSRGQNIEPEPEPAPEPEKTAEEVAFEQALSSNPPAAGDDNADIKPATPEVKNEIPKVEEDEIDCIRIKGERLGVSELWSQLLEADSFDEAVGVAGDMIDVIITGESKKLPDKVDCRPVNEGDHSDGDQSALEVPVLALSGLLGMQAYTKTKQSTDNRVQFNRNAFDKLERESQARRYSSW